MQQVLINIFFSFIEFLAGLILAGALFRFERTFLKISLVALVLAVYSGYFNTYWHFPVLSLTSVLIFWVISLAVVFRISIWYSMLIGIISALVGAGLEFVANFVSELLQNGYHRNLNLLAVSVVISILAYIIDRKKFGYMIPNIYSSPPLNKLFFIVSSLMIAALTALIISTVYYIQSEVSAIHIVIMFSLIAVTYLVVVFSYRFNKKLLKDRYSMFENKMNYKNAM
ncbi:hypothetical protein [Paenibacillus hexagrammi]|uniref:Uncharacterized protein n=1 Tax=Paenibacillus hexagrammi TaxID=2908839 RepID=A0ABY3SP39_9BACL|nr:hypothetical protein [Paenibacillus sp. YPD9-1]UJF34971.1 hypothetical protein L0M14_07450 [Paenibacillus sp. YPD9-1]